MLKQKRCKGQEVQVCLDGVYWCKSWEMCTLGLKLSKRFRPVLLEIIASFLSCVIMHANSQSFLNEADITWSFVVPFFANNCVYLVFAHEMIICSLNTPVSGWYNLVNNCLIIERCKCHSHALLGASSLFIVQVKSFWSYSDVKISLVSHRSSKKSSIFDFF